jgi:hypothetical protein
VFALAVAVVAALTSPSSASDVALLAMPVAAFALWSSVPRAPLALIALAALIPVVAAQRSGGHEPAMFEVSLLAFVIARWSASLATAVALGLLAAASPAAVAVIETHGKISAGIWVLGIAFP